VLGNRQGRLTKLRSGMRVTWMTENVLLLLPALRRARVAKRPART
jgi:hypothetical protein